MIYNITVAVGYTVSALMLARVASMYFLEVAELRKRAGYPLAIATGLLWPLVLAALTLLCTVHLARTLVRR